MMNNNELLTQIMMLDFAVQDASLFLDTHPCDEEAMKYFNEATTRLKNAKKEYQRQGNVLVNREIDAYQNGYLNAPWPWEGDRKCGCMKNACNIQ
ncbi:spore coat protein CotJB [Thomasclavelia sp.]